MTWQNANDLLTRKYLIESRWIFKSRWGQEFSRSFYFGKDGLIKVFRCSNEHSWKMSNGNVYIYNDKGELFWTFDVIVKNEQGQFILFGHTKGNDDVWFSLTEYSKKEEVPVNTPIQKEIQSSKASSQPENVRLVIWDLDETFWKGTLSEEGIEFVKENIDIIDTLNKRGIINSICSKNNFEEVEKVLQELGIWNEFVFPEISFSPKGELVKRIVEYSQLRPETVLFIDDNHMNLNEALHYVPGIQVAEPDFIPQMLADKRFIGKDDFQKNRLRSYKILESKLEKKKELSGDNLSFLRDSDIKISFHNNVEEEFKRIHELVNRTNQLNFTKKRWPEDINEAYTEFEKELSVFGTHSGYVKVSDKYGDYGIVGFYMCTFDNASHFLFSCRTLNMGVEQFTWQHLNRPHIHIVGEVISELDTNVDWITLVDDASEQQQAKTSLSERTICLRGACDMMMTAQFLRTKTNVIEEFNYIYMGWTIFSVPRVVASYNEIMSIENQEILTKLPGIPFNMYASDIIEETADIYILSFPQESFPGYYRIKKTGLILPMSHNNLWPHEHIKRDYTKCTYEEIINMGVTGISETEWTYFCHELEFVGGFDENRFVNDVSWVIEHLLNKNKKVLILGLNDNIGRNEFIMNFFHKINIIMKDISEKYNLDFIPISHLIKNENDLAQDGMLDGTHFARRIYSEISNEIFKYMN